MYCTKVDSEIQKKSHEVIKYASIKNELLIN